MVFQDFINKTKGKKIDVDGLYGGQCVDLFNYWNKLYNDVYINCRPSGYARSLAENKNNNGILKYFKETTVNNMIKGTVVVYGKCKFAPQSHVCFFIKDNGNGTFQALQQNYNGKQYVTINNNPYTGIIGAFIPNQLIQVANNGNNASKVDQIIYKGSRVKFNGIFKVDIIKSPISSNLFGCTQMTGVPFNEYQSESCEDYHWLPTRDFTECDSKGNITKDQRLSGGNSYVKNDNVYTVQEIDVDTNSAKLTINGRDVWVFSKCLLEV